jgi:hypothetical protein
MQFYKNWDWVNKVKERPHNDDKKLYCIRMSFSPNENPGVGEVIDYATLSLKKWGAEKQNPLARQRLDELPLRMRGWIIPFDFPEVSARPPFLFPDADQVQYPNMEILTISFA